MKLAYVHWNSNLKGAELSFLKKKTAIPCWVFLLEIKMLLRVNETHL